MTEREFIVATDLRSIQISIESLKHVIPENSQLIDSAEYLQIVRTLKSWEEKFYEALKTK